ncbi:MAG: hypothetical protein FD146_2399 [Anaerolineaceae bacterium]|nr:MAG: hypothetical protein FD146_2399 [Anaerolineaceae bacterium]
MTNFTPRPARFMSFPYGDNVRAPEGGVATPSHQQVYNCIKHEIASSPLPAAPRNDTREFND